MPGMRNMQNDCSEKTIEFAAGMLGIKVDITYPESRTDGGRIEDEQVDFSLVNACHSQGGGAGRLITKGQNLEELEEGFEGFMGRANKGKCYFVRKGINNGSGHWQVLYFNKEENAWYMRTSPTSDLPFANLEGKILSDSVAAEALIQASAEWGSAGEKHSILLFEATKKVITAAANFVYTTRVENTDKAQEQLYSLAQNPDPRLLGVLRASAGVGKHEQECLSSGISDSFEIKNTTWIKRGGESVISGSTYSDNMLINKMLDAAEVESEDSNGVIEGNINAVIESVIELRGRQFNVSTPIHDQKTNSETQVLTREESPSHLKID